MSVATQWEGLGLVSGLRDSVRALTMAALETPRLWQAPDEELAEGLAAIGRARAVLEAAEVALVREGISRGVPGRESWSEADWVGVSEGRGAPRPSVRDVAAVVRVARAGLRAGSALVDTTHDDEGGGAPLRSDAPEQVAGETQPAAGEWAERPPPAGLAGVLACVEGGELSVGKADQLVRFHEGVRRCGSGAARGGPGGPARCGA